MEKKLGVFILSLCLICSLSFAQGCSGTKSCDKGKAATCSSQTGASCCGTCSSDKEKAACCGDTTKGACCTPAEKAKLQPPKMPTIDPKAWDFLPETVAVVGDKQISKEELTKALGPQVKMLLAMGQKLKPEQYQQLAKNMTDELIKATVLKQLAADAGYKVTPQIEEDVYKKFTEKFEKQLPKGHNVNFEDVIKKQGLDINDVKKQLAEGEVVQQWMKADIAKDVIIDDAAATKFYTDNKDRFFKRPETVSASHILIKPKEDTPAAWNDAKTLADKVYSEVDAGGNFAELAKKYSQCPSKENGGKLGSFSKGQMVPEFEKASWGLAKDQDLSSDKNIANIDKSKKLVEVKTKFGWHIVNVTGYDKGGYVNLDDKLTNEIKTQLKQQEIGKKVNELVENKIKELKPVVNFKVAMPKPPATPATK